MKNSLAEMSPLALTEERGQRTKFVVSLTCDKWTSSRKGEIILNIK